MSAKKVIRSEEENLEFDTPKNDWKGELFNRLRDDLVREIGDDTIYNAIEGYRQFIIEIMIRTSELERLDSEITSRFSRTVWRMSQDEVEPKLTQTIIEIEEFEIDIPLPENELYNDIVLSIWKKNIHEPTWSTEFSLGSKTIRRNKREKLDSNGLLLQEHALIYYYANEFGCFDQCNSDREKIESYTHRHNLSTSYKSFNKLLSKLLRVQERLESGFWEKIFPFLYEWYGAAFSAALRDQERYIQTYYIKEVEASKDTS